MGVRVRAAEDARVEHPGQMNVAGIGGRAGDALDGVDARRSVADGFQRIHGFETVCVKMTTFDRRFPPYHHLRLAHTAVNAEIAPFRYPGLA